MIISKEKLDELAKLSEPLHEWLNKNCHPHCTIVLGDNAVLLQETIACSRETLVTEKFVKTEIK